MYRDIKTSEELSKDFQETNIYQTIQPMEMSVKVLTTGHWPNDQRDTAQIQLTRELNTAINSFFQFYQNRFNNVRQLNWKFGLGHADIRSRLNAPTRYEFSVSTYQMCILLLFNQNAELSYHQLCQMIQIPTNELQVHLIPLIKCKLLTKQPPQPFLQLDDKLSVNRDFKSNLLRNKIGVLVSKQAKEQDGCRT